jgi:hypothetical protein
MTNLMAMPPAARPSWCPSCGQPWEAHWRCPPSRKPGTGKLIVLDRVVADAHSSRVPWQSKVRFRTDLGGLVSSVREERYPNSPATTSHYAHAVQADCAPIMAGYHVRPPHVATPR